PEFPALRECFPGKPVDPEKSQPPDLQPDCVAIAEVTSCHCACAAPPVRWWHSSASERQTWVHRAALESTTHEHWLSSKKPVRHRDRSCGFRPMTKSDSLPALRPAIQN